MDDNLSTDPHKTRLTFSREFNADYYTDLLSQFRTDDEYNDVYTETQKHPLIELQMLNQKQILDYKLHLVPKTLIQLRPFTPIED